MMEEATVDFQRRTTSVKSKALLKKGRIDNLHILNCCLDSLISR